MSTQKTQRQPMSDRHKLIIIITAIVLAAVIAVSATLIVLLQPKNVTPKPNDPSDSISSSLPVKNGDFGLVSSDDTTYPKSALNWTRYGYKAPSGNTHEFETIESTADVVMGIVDTDEENWQKVTEDLAIEQITLGANPKQHNLPEGEKHNNSNVYMIATKKPTNASIMSDSVTVSATTSVKITVWVNTSQLTAGGATIMIQKSSSTPDANEENRYAYQYNIEHKDGWQELSFYVFNRKTSTQYIRVNVGLGNVYTNEATDGANAEGVLYVDDIAFETVTANDYRLKADEAEEGDTSYKIIEKEETTTKAEKSSYMELSALEDTTTDIVKYTTSKEYVDKAKYSPFTTKDDFTKPEDSEIVGDFGIYKIANDGTVKTPVALKLSEAIKLKLDEDNLEKQDYVHISFWVRTVSIDNNALAQANILVQEQNSANEWVNLSNGDFTAKTEQNIETDSNNGWTKYDVYLKPAKAESTIRLVFALGSVKGYEGSEFMPNGELYVTTPYFETISVTAYTSASSSTASKKFDLAGSTAETTVSNGSFSSVSANTKQPTNWTPAFAGENVIYRDGKGNDSVGTGLSTDNAAIEGSGIVRWDTVFDNYVDDDEGNILKLTSNAKSSYGYVSGDITVSAHTVYVFSVMANITKSTGAAASPYFYLLQSGVDRDKAIVAKVDNVYSTTTVNGEIFCQADSIYKDTGWVRYYIVYVAGDKDTTVKLALFNGSIDGLKPAEEGSTVYYDKVTMQNLGTYAMVEDEENEDATEYVVKFTVASDYSDTALGKAENVDEVLAAIKEVSSEIASVQPDDEEWTEMKKIPEDKDDDKDDEPTTPDTPKNEVDLALLFSILSSVLLIAALAVVVVVKIFKKRRNG